MSGRLVPHTADEARVLWSLIVDDIENRVATDGEAVRLLATECVVHLFEVWDEEPPGPRVVVLHGPDQTALVKLADATAAAVGLPRATVPVASMSETGWQGPGIAHWLRGLESDHNLTGWIDWGVVTLSGLDALRIQSGTYHASSDSTRDYRAGKSANLASLLRGEVTPYTRDGAWNATRAMVIVTTAFDLPEHDADALESWGLTSELSALLAPATWIDVPYAQGVVAERAIRIALKPLIRTYDAYGVLLDIATETVRLAAREAEQRGASPAEAASWIAEPARAKLVALLESGCPESLVVVGPDDAMPPASSRGLWVE